MQIAKKLYHSIDFILEVMKLVSVCNDILYNSILDLQRKTYQTKYWLVFFFEKLIKRSIKLIFFFNFFLKLKQIIHRTVKVLTQLIGDW